MNTTGRVRNLIMASLLAMGLTGCSTVDYDAQADQQLTTISQEVNQQFVTWESEASPATPVAYDTKFYDKVEADVKTLEIRMEASQDTSTRTLIPVFDSLNTQFEGLRTVHKAMTASHGGFRDAPFLHSVQDNFNSQIASLLTYELSLKAASPAGSTGGKTDSTATATTGAKAAASAATLAAGPGN
ncbi:MAG TPA: hypothetical protein VII56_02335 [Rhizomicrobium sp.]